MNKKLFPNKYNRVEFKFRMKKNFASVIIPVYKDFVGLQDTLESLSRQTLAKSKYEIIVANDGADKKISEVCKKFGVKEVKVKINKGSYNARNKALEVSRGEYIAFTDADVKVPKNWLKNGVAVLRQYDYVGGPVVFNNKKMLTLVEQYEKIYEFNISNSFRNDFYFVTANVFIKRGIFTSIGAFDNRLKSGGDNEFGNRIHHYTKFNQKYINNPVSHPFRGYNEIVYRKKRIIMGINDLALYFPQRYKHYKAYYVNSILHALTPPTKSLYNFKLFCFIWYLKIIDCYYTFKLRYQYMEIIHKDSRAYKLFGLIFGK